MKKFKRLFKQFKNEQLSYQQLRRAIAYIDIDALNLFDDTSSTKVFNEKLFTQAYHKLCVTAS